MDGEWRWEFRWWCRLFVWEHVLLVDLLVVLDEHLVSMDIDSSSWKAASDWVFSIRHVYMICHWRSPRGLLVGFMICLIFCLWSRRVGPNRKFNCSLGRLSSI